MLIDRNKSALLVVDVQDTLLKLTDNWQSLLANCVWLVKAAQVLSVPVMASEQYRKGLGPTNAELLALLPTESVADKLHFSCVAADCLKDLPGVDRKQIILCGIESHVCVFQTAVELQAAGKEVFVVADAVTSRSANDKALALNRLTAQGIQVVGKEMVVFEWMRQSGIPEFKEISKNFLR